MRNSGQHKHDSSDWNEAWDVDYLWGTCLLVNLKAAEKVGLMDEQFFMYYEDLDWSIRFRQAGYRLRLVGKARLYHRVAVSTGGTDSPLHRFYLARSSILFFRRHAHLGSTIAIFFFRFGSALKMVARLCLTGRPKSAAAYLQGLRDGWRVSQGKTG
jgi:GT2 family glycosyltransferase